MLKNVFVAAVLPVLLLIPSLSSAKNQEATPHGILNILGGPGSNIGTCELDGNTMMKSVAHKFDQAEFMSAAGYALSDAQTLSFCEIHEHVMPFSDASSEIGDFLAFDAIASVKGGLDDANTATMAQYAKTLLQKYPGYDGGKFIQEMREDGLFGAPKPPKPTGVGVQTTPNRLVSEYNSNSVGFLHINTGKTFTVTGKVSKVISMGKGAQVSFDGDPKVKLNDRGFQDYVYCEIPHKNVNESYSLERGQTITVRGVYSPKHAVESSLMPIQLLNCHVVQ